jgi:hypothetical protein
MGKGSVDREKNLGWCYNMLYAGPWRDQILDLLLGYAVLMDNG